jgi:para-aminobenzoate synthetase
MEIVDELEGVARGIYSGAIGYLGLGGGCDLSVTIRTIVLEGSSATIGTGGAIVLQSDAHNELQEALLKARAPMCAVDPLAADSAFPLGGPDELGCLPPTRTPLREAAAIPAPISLPPAVTPDHEQETWP